MDVGLFSPTCLYPANPTNIRISRKCSIQFYLETSVGRKKDVQDIDVHGEYEKRVVTLLVISGFSDFPGASRACADFRDPTEVSRFNH